MKQRFFFVALATLHLVAAIASSPALAEADAESAACGNAVLKIVGEHFGLDAFDFPRGRSYASAGNDGRIVAGACKPSPTNSNEVITAFAYDAGDIGEKTLVVAIIDQPTSTIISSYSYEFIEDPGGIEKIKIDTARYAISSGVRAFGIDITPGYSHNCGDGGREAERTLYVQHGKSIRPVLYISAIKYWNVVSGFRCGPSTPLIIENTALTLKVLSSKTNGYKDILITSSSDRSDGKPSTKKKSHYTYRYNGQEYVRNQTP